MLKSQEILLRLVGELDEICKKNNITYYLIGGSALGAVRHHGFLPWDDDADIVMDHENYMKFAQVMSNPDNIPANRAYEDPFIAPFTHMNVFGRYSDTGTTCIFNSIAYDKCKHGIKVDVFHLLPCPDEGEERDVFLKKFRKWAELCHPTARNNEMTAEDYLATIEEAYTEGEAAVRKKLFDDMHVERYTDCRQYLYGYEKFHIFYDRDIFGEPVYFPFESLMLPVPTKYTEHFRILFGDDWYIIPDSDEQITHLITQDENRSYLDYTSDYRHYALVEQKELRQEYKYTVFKCWEAQKEIASYQTSLRKALVEKKLDEFYNRERENIVSALTCKDYQLVIEILKPYFDEQLNTYTDRWDMFLDVDKNMFKSALIALLYTSKNKIARRLLDMADDYYIDEDIAPLKDFLFQKDYIIEMEDSDCDIHQILDENERLLSSHANDRDLLLRKARLLLKTEGTDAKETVLAICRRFPDDGDFIAVTAELCECLNDKAKAVDLYEAAISHTRNGLVIMDCEKALAKLGLSEN